MDGRDSAFTLSTWAKTPHVEGYIPGPFSVTLCAPRPSPKRSLCGSGRHTLVNSSLSCTELGRNFCLKKESQLFLQRQTEIKCSTSRLLVSTISQDHLFSLALLPPPSAPLALPLGHTLSYVPTHGPGAWGPPRRSEEGGVAWIAIVLWTLRPASRPSEPQSSEDA